MKLQVVSYHSGIPRVNKSPEKSNILYNFVKGVNAVGDIGRDHHGFDVQESDVAVLQGFVHENSKNMPHLLLRRAVLEKQKMTRKKTLVADSNLFLWVNTSNKPHHYLRYSWDGVFRRTGFYFDKDVDPTRWQQIKNDLGIEVKPYRKSGNHILICLQRNGGWSMKNNDVMEFCHTVISKLKQYSDRPIVVRAHPGDKKAAIYLRLRLPNVTVSTNPNIDQDLENAWATVVFNSSPGVASFIRGIPVFQMDPEPEYSMYGELANFELSQIEQPVLKDRNNWLERISMCHWKFDELIDGSAWKFMRNYV